MRTFMNSPNYPLYVVSKGRYEYMMTSKALTAMGLEHYVVIEPHELEAYTKAIEETKVSAIPLVMDLKYKDIYDTCDEYGLELSTGPGAARNFAWEHSIKNGFDYHWVMDDNIHWFYRYNDNMKYPCRSKGLFRAMEDFTKRYSNVYMSGPNYFMFVKRKDRLPPFVSNTRIYSCNFIKNDIPFRWRGRYNEDTILSLDILSAGYCTIQFNTFLQDKYKTQLMRGGNTDEFYFKEGVKERGVRYAYGGTDAKTQMLFEQYPEYTKIVDKFGRKHHQINYRVFEQPLTFVEGFDMPIEDNEYGMILKEVEHYRQGY